MKRIQKEQKDLLQDPSPYFFAEPLDSEPFEWHFTLRGPPQTPFEGGFYHGVITLPYAYPFKPPYIVFLTPSGRFQIKEKICLTFTNYHPEYWQPAWTIRNILQALVSFLPVDEGQLSIGALVGTKEERQRLAKKSVDFVCPQCGPISAIIRDKIPELTAEIAKKKPKADSEFEKLLQGFTPAKQVAEKEREEVKREKEESVRDEEAHIRKMMEESLAQEQAASQDAGKQHVSKKGERGEKKKARKEGKQGEEEEGKQREKIEKIREKGLKAYKKRLLQQLEQDSRKKLMVINMLFLTCVLVVGMMYYNDIDIEIKWYNLLK